MKFYTKEEILDILENTETLKDAIIKSKGFILYLSDKYEIKIEPQKLIDSISNYSIRYITEDMKVQKYTKEQKSIVISYLKEDSDDIHEKTIEYTKEQLLIDLKEDNDLPRFDSSSINLNFNDFLENQKDFASILKKANDDSYWKNDFKLSHNVLYPIFKNINKEDFLKIDIHTLSEYPGIFYMSKHLLSDLDIKRIFNEAVKLHFQIPEVKNGGYRPKLEDYSYYPFSEDEKELFISLLKNEYTRDYESIRRYQGFSNFFNKQDYILDYNISGIQYLTKKEIADLLPNIRTSIVNAYFNGNRHYKTYDDLYKFKIDEESFKAIFSEDFIKSIILKAGQFDFEHFDRDYQDRNKNINYFNKAVYNLCSKDTEILNIVGYQNLINHATNLIDHDRSYYNEEYAKPLHILIKNFHTQLNSELLFLNTSENKIGCYKEYDIPDLIFESMSDKEPTINYLYALMKIAKEDKKHWVNSKFVGEINRIIPLLNKDDVMYLSKIVGYPYKIDKSILNSNNSHQDYYMNFLKINAETIKSMPFHNFEVQFKINPNFRNYILDNSLDYLIIEQIKNDDSNYSRKNLIKFCLNETRDPQSPYFKFLKLFIKNNKEFILEKHFEDLVTHPLREKLIKIDTKDLEKDSFQQIELLIEDLALINYEKNFLNNDYENLSKKERKQYDKLQEEISVKSRKIEDDIKKLFSNISFDYFLNKIKESEPIKSIRLYNISNNRFKNAIYDKIQSLDFLTTKDLLNNKEFLNFIYSNKPSDSYGDKEKRKFFLNPSFSDSQNIELVEIMYKNFNLPNTIWEKYSKNVSFSTVLSFIKEDERKKITNNLVIKHDPEALFNSYDYLPGGGVFFDRHVRERFTTKQLITAIENLNSKGKKIICVSNQNTSHDNMLSANYKYEKMDGKNPYFNEYKDLLKYLENDPINYLACIHSDIVLNFINRDNFKNTDIAISSFHNEHINAKVVQKGIEEILRIHQSFYSADEIVNNHDLEKDIYKGVSINNSLKAVSNFISYTYHSNDGSSSSEFDKDKSQAILKTIINDGPHLFFSIPYIGKVGSTSDELSNNFKNYFHPNFIEDFFLNDYKSKILDKNLRLEYENRNKYWQSISADSFIKTVIENLTKNNDRENLLKLDFILKENYFNEQRPYGKKNYDFYNQLTEFATNTEYLKLIEKSILFVDLLSSSNEVKPKITKKNKI